MKKASYVLLAIWLAALPIARASAQIEIIGEAVKRVIMAIDLRVQRLQTKTILLQDVQKQVENDMHALQLGAITDWVQRQKDLYDGYYRELWQVKNVLVSYSRVKDMINRQARLIRNCQAARSAIQRDPHFNAAELDHVYRILDGILEQSVQNVGALSKVITALVTQMDDGSRLQIINGLGERVDKGNADLDEFMEETILLSLQRARDEREIGMLKSLYGIP